MTIVLILLVLGVAFPAFAERELTIGEYTAEAQQQVAAEISKIFADSEATMAGTVTFAGGGCFFLQKDHDGIKVLASGKMPSPGDVVEVTGTPSLDGGRVVFAEKSRKTLKKGNLPQAMKASLDALISVKGGANAIRSLVTGRAIGGIDGGFALDVNGVPINVKCDELPDFLADADVTHPKVTVCGVVETVLDQSVLFGRGNMVLGVRMYVATGADIMLIPDVFYYARRGDMRVRFAIGVVILALSLALLAFGVMIFRQRQRLFRSRTLMAERKRMADDIHDTIEQHLVGAKMLIALGRSKEATDVLVRAKRELRDIIWGLKNDDMMRQMPAEMLRELAKAENAKGLYRVDVKLDSGLPVAMDASRMRDLSLIVREAIGNAVKHGGAKRIALVSDPRPDGGWTLRMSNDGIPFDPETAPGAAEGHFGLSGMRERARRMGVEIKFSRRKEGMMVSLEAKK